MITVSSEMILKSVLFSALSGMIFGFVRSLLLCFIIAVGSVLKGNQITSGMSDCRGGFWRHVVDFILVFSLGIIYLLSGYVFLDGAYEVYSLSVLVLSSAAFNRLFSRIFVLRRKKMDQKS